MKTTLLKLKEMLFVALASDILYAVGLADD